MVEKMWDTIFNQPGPQAQPEDEIHMEEGGEEEDGTENRYDVAQRAQERADFERARVLSLQEGYRPQAPVLDALRSLGINGDCLSGSRGPAASVGLGGAVASLDPACGFTRYFCQIQ